jgi:phosphohistidine phosphatase
MRHGEAEVNFSSDRSRSLTQQGQSDVIEMAKHFQNTGEPGIIATSPYLRANQTAGLVTDTLGLGTPILIWDELMPTGQPPVVLEKIVVLDSENVMLVTHQPFITHFIDYLTGVETGMGTASIVAIHFQELLEGCGDIDWIKHRH